MGSDFFFGCIEARSGRGRGIGCAGYLSSLIRFFRGRSSEVGRYRRGSFLSFVFRGSGGSGLVGGGLVGFGFVLICVCRVGGIGF